jgi:hypothetical protein
MSILMFEILFVFTCLIRIVGNYTQLRGAMEKTVYRQAMGAN